MKLYRTIHVQPSANHEWKLSTFNCLAILESHSSNSGHLQAPALGYRYETVPIIACKHCVHSCQNIKYTQILSFILSGNN